MDPLITSTALNIGGNLLGGLFGGKKGPGINEQINNQRVGMEKLIPAAIHAEAKAKHEVSDMYGIHPLVLFGSGLGGGYSPTFQYDNDRGFDYEGLGQNVGRLAEVVSTKGERAFQRVVNGLTLERMKLENTLLASQISSVNRTSIPPRPGADYRMPGQGDDSVLYLDPKGYHASHDGLEVGERAALQTMRFPGLGGVRTKSEALGDAMEDSFLGSLMVDLLYTVPDLIYASGRKLPRGLADIIGYHHDRSPYRRWKNKNDRAIADRKRRQRQYYDMDVRLPLHRRGSDGRLRSTHRKYSGR